MGLWLLEDAKAGERVALYTGDLLNAQEAAASTSAYLLMVNKNVVLDARDPTHEKGRSVNDGKVAGRKVNAAFGAAQRPAYCKETGRPYVSIRATCDIKAGTEILVSYGAAYWGKGGFCLRGNLPARRKAGTALPLGTAFMATPQTARGEGRDAREVVAPTFRVGARHPETDPGRAPSGPSRACPSTRSGGRWTRVRRAAGPPKTLTRRERASGAPKPPTRAGRTATTTAAKPKAIMRVAAPPTRVLRQRAPRTRRQPRRTEPAAPVKAQRPGL